MTTRVLTGILLLLLVTCIAAGLVAAWKFVRRQRAESERRRRSGLSISPHRQLFSGDLPEEMFVRWGFWMPILVAFWRWYGSVRCSTWEVDYRSAAATVVRL